VAAIIIMLHAYYKRHTVGSRVRSRLTTNTTTAATTNQ